MKKIILFCLIGLLSLPLFAQKEANLYKEFCKQPNTSKLQDFSYAGYRYGTAQIPALPIKINVSKCGVQPNTGKDLTVAIQHLIDSIGKTGGGVLYFPKGRYNVNMDTTRVQFLTIDYNNIVIRGEGSDKDGTIIFSGSNTLQELENPWISPAVIRTGYKIQPSIKFWSAKMKKTTQIYQKSNSGIDTGSDGSVIEAPILTEITKSALRGSKVLKVKNSTKIKSDDCILVVMYNTADDSNLLKYILNYDSFTPDLETAINAGKSRAPSFQWLVEVDKVIDKNTIQLKQPFRIDILEKFEPAIAAAPMLKGIGVENIRFESAWDGYYLHHGGGVNTPRMSKLMDYGWNAINFCRVKNGWIQHVSVDNYTNPIYLQDSRNVTVQNILLEGNVGHAGLKLYAHSADNLIQNIKCNMYFTHVLSSEGNVYGNVFRNIDYTAINKLETNFDFHGFSGASYAPPAWNLFENITGLIRINGGGAGFNFPHTAHGNVWWNIYPPKNTEAMDVFRHWIFGDKPNMPPHYYSYPGSIIVGFGTADSKYFVDKSAADREETMITVEKLNQAPVYPLSLYEAQLNKRLKK